VDHLGNLALSSVNFSLMTKEDRKTIRSEVPVGLKNIRELLKTLQKALDYRKIGRRVEIEDDDWESQLSEMEFLDSESELEYFLPPDVDKLTDEEPDSSDEASIEDDDDALDSEDLEFRKKKRKAQKKVKVQKKSKKKYKPTTLADANIKKITISLNRPEASFIKAETDQNRSSNRQITETFVAPAVKNELLLVTPNSIIPPPLPKMIVPRPAVVAASKPLVKKSSVFGRLDKKLKKR
jgi:hypothetical protein